MVCYFMLLRTSHQSQAHCDALLSEARGICQVSRAQLEIGEPCWTCTQQFSDAFYGSIASSLIVIVFCEEDVFEGKRYVLLGNLG